MTCDITERTSRGYCPNQADEHQSELDVVMEIQVDTAGDLARDQLPETGLDSVLLWAAAAVGIALVFAGLVVLIVFGHLDQR